MTLYPDPDLKGQMHPSRQVRGELQGKEEEHEVDKEFSLVALFTLSFEPNPGLMR